MTRAAVTLLALPAVLAVGCAAPTEPAAIPAEAAPAPVTAPATLTYQAVGVTAEPLEPTGLDGDGEIAVPPVTDPGTTVWLRWSPRLAPGRPLVVAAHVNGRGPDGQPVPGTFAELADATTGDTISVTDTAGRTVDYQVRSVVTVPKDAFPTSVYRPRAEPTLLAITCGGDLDRAAHSYTDNVLVEAVAAPRP